jgi:hypothetical protein
VRRVSIVVICDACEEEVQEETEGDSVVRFTSRGGEREMDLCDSCYYGTFLQEARPVINRKKRKKAELDTPGEFPCDSCEKAFPTMRGLNQHRTRMHE